MKAPAVILLSGGIDSTACTHFLLERGFDVSAVFVDFGQTSRVHERESALRLAGFYRIPLRTLDLSTEAAFNEGEIPGRNAFLVFSALMYCGLKSGVLAMGIHADSPYYDCSPGFVAAAAAMVADYSAGRIRLFVPFMQWSKANILEYCSENKVPLDLTYSCERGRMPPCGKCLSCRDRGSA